MSEKFTHLNLISLYCRNALVTIEKKALGEKNAISRLVYLISKLKMLIVETSSNSQ